MNMTFGRRKRPPVGKETTMCILPTSRHSKMVEAATGYPSPGELL
jgi:hypothetical protein